MSQGLLGTDKQADLGLLHNVIPSFGHPLADQFKAKHTEKGV